MEENIPIYVGDWVKVTKNDGTTEIYEVYEVGTHYVGFVGHLGMYLCRKDILEIRRKIWIL